MQAWQIPKYNRHSGINRLMHYQDQSISFYYKLICHWEKINDF